MSTSFRAAALLWVAVVTPLAATLENPASTIAIAGDSAGGPSWFVPRPDLSSLQQTPRERIEALQATVDRLIADATTENSELAEAFGFLGRFFHAFEQLDAAAICYANARTLAPAAVEWPYYLALVRQAQGDLEGAATSYRAALAIAPADAATRLRLAGVLLDLGRIEESRIHFDAVLGRDGENAAALLGLGRVADLAGDPATAIERFEAALRRQPEASEIHYLLAQAYRQLGDEPQAALHLDRQGERKVTFADPRGDMLNLIAKNSALGVVADLAGDLESFSEDDFLGFVLAQLGTTRGAAEQLQQLLGRLAEDPSASAVQSGRIEYAVGALVAGEGRDAEAITHFERAVLGDPNLRDARVKLGNARARSRMFDEAVDAYDQALAMGQPDADLLMKRASALVNLDRPEDARSDLRRAVELEPASPDGWRLLAGLEEQLGDAEGAVTAWGRALEVTDEPESKMALHTELADVYYRQRRFETAARENLKALRIDQGYVPALERLARILGQVGEYDRAAEVYAKWIAVDPVHVAPRLGEATALILAGRHAAARDRLEAGVAILPESLDLKDVLARHLAVSPDPAVRDGVRAVALAHEIYRGVPTAESMATLAMAYAEAGQFSEATSWQKRLLSEGAERDVDGATLALWRANLELYEAGRPCCATAAE